MNVETRIQDEFESNGFLKTIGAKLVKVEPGKVILSLEMTDNLTQQLGYMHAGAIATLADAASGLAALSMMPEDKTVLSVEFKQNNINACKEASIYAIASVIKSGRTLTVTNADVIGADSEKMIAKMQATMIAIDKK
ncbi:PaaI family thioesterase [Aerococcaceae bacterium DSM 111020]|nr:PaaI family thioesterase [Aerococcaceae bacterium DSM 111020]